MKRGYYVQSTSDNKPSVSKRLQRRKKAAKAKTGSIKRSPMKGNYTDLEEGKPIVYTEAKKNM